MTIRERLAALPADALLRRYRHSYLQLLGVGEGICDPVEFKDHDLSCEVIYRMTRNGRDAENPFTYSDEKRPESAKV